MISSVNIAPESFLLHCSNRTAWLTLRLSIFKTLYSIPYGISSTGVAGELLDPFIVLSLKGHSTEPEN